MPLASANWKVLLPTWRGLAGAGWLSLARLAALGAAAASEAAARRRMPASAILEPVKPTAAVFLGFGGGRLAALVHLGIGIDGPAGVGRGGGQQQLVGEAAVGILHRGALVGVQTGANARIGLLHLGIGQQHFFAGRVIAPHAGGHGPRIGVAEQSQLR